MRSTNIASIIALVLANLLAATSHATGAAVRPNVIVILTDDQGFGELGATGNPIIRTPHIDRFAAAGVSLVNFHVMPVCSPTRACLMTGRYNYRTGVTDTYLGRSLMHPDETTLAEMLAAGGYRTGIFGKWHLGDNYPMRAMDKGFEETLVLNGGGLAQPGDPPDPVDERGAYFNATLRHNGTWVKTKGYVSDVITDAAMPFHREEERSAVLRLSALQLPARAAPGAGRLSPALPGQRLQPRQLPQAGASNGRQARRRRSGPRLRHDREHRRQRGPAAGKTRRTQTGRQHHRGPFLRQRLPEAQRLQRRLSRLEGSTFEGGIHQFCFLRWPGQFQASRQVDRIAAHIDLAPTLLDLCGVPKPSHVKFDGLSLAPLLRGQQAAWPDRVLFFQWHRGDAPERYRAFAARSQDWKLVQPLGVGEKWNGKTAFQLYDMAHDPLELHDLAAQEPDRVAKLKAQYDAWFNDVTAGRDYAVPSRIFLGAAQENPVLLTRQDWRGGGASWGPGGIGYWEVKVVARGPYEIEVAVQAVENGR